METSLDQMWYLPGMFNYQKASVSAAITPVAGDREAIVFLFMKNKRPKTCK